MPRHTLWFDEVERIALALANLAAESGREFVIGIGDGTTGIAEDLHFISAGKPDVAGLREIIGVERVNLPHWVPEKCEYDGVHPDAFLWEELSTPQFYPESVAGQIAGMGLTQPGCDDNGARDSATYSLDDWRP